ncbi:Reticulon-domain-containing protein [Dunaliella salina]|uniref:Reticulon-like protein n=1 Tax=Dunaliella salina TaxID=3046 RepID=A0ABQ7H331_DUNSA|nr:Reticulon-domain-containing protein [Dunaliella salina]|eukprot:KAF5841269.1 Reticulon-domain-containing protein [Dunaliella salina]
MSLVQQLSNRVPKEHKDVLLWRDLKKSGVCFGGSTAAYILVAWAPISFFVLGLQAVTVAVATTLLWSLGAKMFSAKTQPADLLPDVLKTGFEQEALNEVAQKYRPLINLVLCTIGRVLSGEDAPLSLKVFAAGMALSWLAARVSLITAAYLIVFLAFTGPKVYEMKQKEIDQAFALVGDKMKGLYKKFDETVLKKIPGGPKSNGPKSQ